MIKNKYTLNLLKLWERQYEKENISVKIYHDENIPIGNGVTKWGTNNEETNIVIGIAPLHDSHFLSYQRVKDTDFVRIGITLYHEITHYQHLILQEKLAYITTRNRCRI